MGSLDAMIRLAASAVLALTLAAEPASAAPALPRVALDTPEGRIVVEVDTVHAPDTAANFLRYVDTGLFRGAHFYRVVRPDNDPRPTNPMMIIQGGLSPAKAPLAPIAHETTQATGLRHDDGAISMARAEPGTAGSEFFIVIGKAPGLDFGPNGRNPDGQGYAVFGHVVRGMDVVRRINTGAVGPGGPIAPNPAAPPPRQALLAPVPISAAARLP